MLNVIRNILTQRYKDRKGTQSLLENFLPKALV